MKAVLRITILVGLAFLGLILFFGEEQETDLAPLLFLFLIDKIIGLAALCAFGRLYSRWSSIDPLIERFDKWVANDDI